MSTSSPGGITGGWLCTTLSYSCACACRRGQALGLIVTLSSAPKESLDWEFLESECLSTKYSLPEFSRGSGVVLTALATLKETHGSGVSALRGQGQGELLETQGCVCVWVSVSGPLCHSAAAGSFDLTEAPSSSPPPPVPTSQDWKAPSPIVPWPPPGPGGARVQKLCVCRNEGLSCQSQGHARDTRRRDAAAPPGPVRPLGTFRASPPRRPLPLFGTLA